eukprot:TCONS_00036470-protein
MTRVGDTFIQELNQKGEDMSSKYGFVEIADSDVDGVPVDDLPIGLQKCKELNLPNPIIEIDLAYFAFDYEKWNLDKICELLDKRIKWTRENVSKDSKIYINFRDFSDAMVKAPERVLGLVRYISSYRPKLTGILYEEFGANFPEELGIYTRSVKGIMDSCGYDGHLLIHIHHQWGLSDASILECLASGANGIWAGICEEGAAMGHASTCLTLMNLIRLGNTKVLKRYNCQELRNAAIAVTKSVTGDLPPPKTVVVGERALDRVFGFPAFEPEHMEGFCLNTFFGDKANIRITTLADNKMIRDALIENFGEDEQFTLEIGTKMKELMLEDLTDNRKEEYQSCFGLAMLFDRAGGQQTAKMAEAIEKTTLKSQHIEDLIKEIRVEWDEWDLRDNNQIDDMLDFNAFYNGFMAPYFGCYRCDETRKALKALDMDSDGWIDWNEFLVYLKWAGNAYPDTHTARELLDLAFKDGLLPAMQDVLVGTVKDKIEASKK